MNEPLTIERVCEIGFGQLRLNPISFFEMTIDEFICAVRGFHELNEIREQQHWERTRWLATVMLTPHAKKHSHLKPTDIATFPWEEKKKKTAADGEQLLRQLMK